MKEQIIHLEPQDDVVSVRDRLNWARANRVLLVFPDDPRQRILQRKLDLVLIQREATRKQAQLALITRDPEVIKHAQELGIACFASLKASSRRYWETSQARPKVSRREQPRQLTPDLIAAGSRLNENFRGLPKKVRRTLEIAVFAVAMLVLLAVVIFVLPGATIHLSPAAEQVTVTVSVTADPEVALVDIEQGLIPGRVIGVEVETSATVETTGTEPIPTEKARGVALFTNLLPDQVTIPQGTIVRTSAAQPVRFITLADATLPGQVGETIEIPIEAIEAGYEGNIPRNRINQIEGPLDSRVAVTNSEPTAGGDVTDIRAISQADYDRVHALALQQLQQRAFAEMQTDPYIALLETEFVPVESLKVVLIHSETYLGYIGEPSDEVGLNMRVTVQGVAIDERFARQVIYGQIAQRVGEGYQIAPDTLLFRRGEIIEVSDRQTVKFIMKGTSDVYASIEPGEVYQVVRGIAVSEAVFELDRELPLAAPPSIEVWPSFWPVMPFLPLRMKLDIAGQS